MISKLFTCLCLCGFFNPGVLDFSFELSLIHLNDLHDRIDESNENSGSCSGQNCISGISRIYTAINQLINTRPNPIVLNAGDNFQGTLWYNHYKWNATQYFLNFIYTDVYTLGNHEFDDGVEGLVPFLKALKAPVVVCNLDISKEPRLQGLYNKSIVIERAGKRIGIIGVVTKSTADISYNENIKFLNEIESVNAEAKRLDREDNVDTIIVLSHCGYFKEKLLAEKAAPKISVIVGGHSHTLLYNGNPPGTQKPAGRYPTIVNHKDGRTILILQASAYGKFLGNITIQYDGDNKVSSWSGAPIYLNKSIPQDDFINCEIELWKTTMHNVTPPLIVGETKVLLQKKCSNAECNIGNLVTDAMVHSHLHTDEEFAWTYASIAVVNGGALRISLQRGNISSDDISMLIPFRNTIDVVQMKGKHLKEFLELGVGNPKYKPSKTINLLQVSGIQIVYNLTKPIGSRIEILKLRCRVCQVPVYQNVKENNNYRIIMNSFLSGGKGGYDIFLPYMKILKVGDLHVNVVTDYIKRHSPIVADIQGRIKVIRP